MDTIVWGTGFKANKFLWPIDIKGKGGVSVNDFWAGSPAAFKGLSMPQFPNLFMCYGCVIRRVALRRVRSAL